MMFGKISNEVNVTVDGGYKPDHFKLKAGALAKVTFTRVSDKGCTQQVIFNGEKRDLPLNQPVTFEFTPEEKGTIDWSCGMKMVHGKYVVK
jgi:Cu+-exporting ATPase